MKSCTCVGGSIALPVDCRTRVPNKPFSSEKTAFALVQSVLLSLASGALAASFGTSSQSVSVVILVMGAKLRETMNHYRDLLSGV
jgi:hypothetical protein